MLFYAYLVFRGKGISDGVKTERNQLEKLFLEGKPPDRLGLYVRRYGSWPRGWGARPLPRGAPEAPPTYFLHPYIPTYPKISRTENRSGVPPSQASVATKNLSGARSGTLPEGGYLTGGHLHHPGALHDKESAEMMKMATGDGFPLRQGAGTGSREVFGGYRGLRRRNS